MNALAADAGCHGWQMQAFACEGHNGNILSPTTETDLIRIEACREILPDVDGRGCVEYEIKELASVFIGEGGELHVIDRASAQRGEESPL
ncbi:hypothetical protein [Halocynthiibacter sp.]|uniref:hypothetical protein n=1 Tax=Halocynthiibacter sp. TaxID=1979210 RepID=UPI003C539161